MDRSTKRPRLDDDAEEALAAPVDERTKFHVVLGSVESGKTTFVKENVVFRLGKKVTSWAKVYTTTPESYDWLPSKNVYNGDWSMAEIEKDVRAIVATQKDSAYVAMGACIEVIMDDIHGAIGLSTHEKMRNLFKELATTNRHRRMQITVVLHSAKGAPDGLLTSCHRIHIFRQAGKKSTRILHNEIGGSLDFDEFHRRVTALNQYEYLIYNRNKPGQLDGPFKCTHPDADFMTTEEGVTMSLREVYVVFKPPQGR